MPGGLAKQRLGCEKMEGIFLLLSFFLSFFLPQWLEAKRERDSCEDDVSDLTAERGGCKEIRRGLMDGMGWVPT